jgi:hypothetical protein
MFALFDENKKFAGFSPDIPSDSKILKIKLPDEQSDIRFWHWEGDYDSGKMVSNNTGYPVEELELEKELFKYIERKYPLTIQLVNIIKQIRKIVQYDKNIQDYEFMDMADSILNAIDKQVKRINYYKNYEKFIPKYETQK